MAVVQYSVQLLGQFWLQFNTIGDWSIGSQLGGIKCVQQR
jgi:hypothetical protein